MRDNAPDKQKLRNCIKKSMKTVCVGSISTFEKNFGHLWGHGEDEENLTDEQLAYRERWEETREEIFDRYHASEEIAINACNKVSIKKRKFFDKID